MANGHGGRRTPAKPAAVSGPGRLSKRTDGGVNQGDISGEPYGQGQDFREAQRGASMGTPPSPAGMNAGGQAAPSLVPLDAPTERPDEPVTAGAALGAGIGPEQIGLGDAAIESEDMTRLKTYLPALLEMASRPDSTASFRNYVRLVRAKATGA